MLKSDDNHPQSFHYEIKTGHLYFIDPTLYKSNKPQMDEQAKKYIDSQSSNFYNTLLKRCMGRGHKKTKYLFNPRITEEWREGGTLVVGINHWCTQKECEHYADCVLNSNSRKYDKPCQWAVSEVDETTRYDLRYTTYEAFNCYLSGFTGYRGFKEFLKEI